MGNQQRKVKLRLWNKDPHCHWCGVETVLTDTAFLGSNPNPRMATVDHLYTRFDPRRFVEPKPGEVTKVLACFKCNNERSRKDCIALSPEEKIRRGKYGFKLRTVDKNGKPLFQKKPKTLKEVLEIFANNGIVLDNEKQKRECSTVAG